MTELNFAHTSIPDADFRNLNLTGASFRSCYLHRADFRNAICRDADFSCSDLRGANFQGADLTGADFRDADTVGTLFDHSDSSVKLLNSSLPLPQLKTFNVQISRTEDDSFTVVAGSKEEAEALAEIEIEKEWGRDWEVDCVYESNQPLRIVKKKLSS